MGSFINPTILIETTSPSPLFGTLVVDIEGTNYHIAFSEACDGYDKQIKPNINSTSISMDNESDVEVNTVLESQKSIANDGTEYSPDDIGIHNCNISAHQGLNNIGHIQTQQFDLCSSEDTPQDNHFTIKRVNQIIRNDSKKHINASPLANKDNWNYRTNSDTSISCISISTDYQAEAIQIAELIN